jgi:hypothetical protein
MAQKRERGDRALWLAERRLLFDPEASDPARGGPVEPFIRVSGGGHLTPITRPAEVTEVILSAVDATAADRTIEVAAIGS